MIAIFAVFMIENIISGKKSLSADSGEVEKTEHTGKQMALNIVKFLIGPRPLLWEPICSLMTVP